MTERAREVAKGLTKAQREEVLSLSGDWTVRRYSSQMPPWLIWLPPSVLEQATPTLVHFQRLRLTPFGLAVRSILENEHGAE